jgi:para-nitrobenzyl esterase
VRGVREGAVTAFKGIPYAAAPVGALMFGPPAPPASWDGVRDATQFGPTAPRTGYPPPFDKIFFDPEIAGDDYLNLNVWTPEPSGSGLPVFVWIHGGAFRNGTSAADLYDGVSFARDGLVFVSMNYRLGIEGFLYVDDAPAPANRGLLDQIAALEWVQENIARFGGDPGNVTVCGESAGSMSVVALLTSPRAKGLFHRAIAQSGAGHHALEPVDARRVTAGIAKQGGVPATAEGLATLASPKRAQLEAKIALDITTSLDPKVWGRLAVDLMPFEPTIDGDVVPALPITTIKKGVGADVQLLTGTTAEEWRLFVVPPGLISFFQDSHVDMALAGYSGSDPGLTQLYAALGGTAGERLCVIITDWYLWIPAVRMAEARADGPASTFLYELAWRSPLYKGAMGACHGLDLPFVFETLGTESGRALAGDAAPQELAERMHAAWVSFARAGDPGWAPYESGSREVMMFDENSEVVSDPHGDRREAWSGLR